MNSSLIRFPLQTVLSLFLQAICQCTQVDRVSRKHGNKERSRVGGFHLIRYFSIVFWQRNVLVYETHRTGELSNTRDATDSLQVSNEIQLVMLLKSYG